MLVQAIIIGIIAMAVTFEWCIGSCLLTRPIVTGVLIGIAMGNLKMGIIMGATLELAFIGAVTLGAAVPPDVITGGILGAAFAISTGKGANVALTLAFPVASLYLLLDNVMTLVVMPIFVHKADKYIEEDNLNAAARMHFLGGFFVKSLPRGLFVGLAFYFGSPVMKTILNGIPQFVQNGLTIAAGIIPALGIALLAQMILNKKVVVFFILGFIIYAYLKVPILGIAILGFIIAFVILSGSNKSDSKEVVDDDNF